ncbi:hypothetical protein BCY84_12486 [Trypanosoma cruzi cruzi]|nr:hypothetical protein BCY84_12486 [Trypanosoma cruzi cruzi]
MRLALLIDLVTLALMLIVVVGCVLLSLMTYFERANQRRRQERLRNCQRAEPFAPPVSLPMVVDAVVVSRRMRRRSIGSRRTVHPSRVCPASCRGTASPRPMSTSPAPSPWRREMLCPVHGQGMYCRVCPLTAVSACLT